MPQKHLSPHFPSPQLLNTVADFSLDLDHQKTNIGSRRRRTKVINLCQRSKGKAVGQGKKKKMMMNVFSASPSRLLLNFPAAM